jgi:cell fate regulator YaaT (PSP1 superfamily)
MKLVKVHYLLTATKAVFYFTADGRVDFRGLVKDMAAELRIRIEMRQIGVRDETKLLGGVGHCGRELCCSTWLRSFVPVSIRMAKDQNLALNPQKVSGACGRLMCCLAYEHETYVEMKRELPKVGKRVNTTAGLGRVTNLEVLKGRFVVELDDGGRVLLSPSDLLPYKGEDMVEDREREDGRQNKGRNDPESFDI